MVSGRIMPRARFRSARWGKRAERAPSAANTDKANVASCCPARLEQDDPTATRLADHPSSAKRLAQQRVPISAAMITLVSRSAETAAIGLRVIAQITKP